MLATGWTDIGVEQLEDRMAELEEESEEGETGFSIEFAVSHAHVGYLNEIMQSFRISEMTRIFLMILVVQEMMPINTKIDYLMYSLVSLWTYPFINLSICQPIQLLRS